MLQPLVYVFIYFVAKVVRKATVASNNIEIISVRFMVHEMYSALVEINAY